MNSGWSGFASTISFMRTDQYVPANRNSTAANNPLGAIA